MCKLEQVIWRASKHFDRLKYGFEVKIVEEQGIGARSLACGTLGVEGRAGVLGWG